MEPNCEPMDQNRIEDVGERARNRQALVIQAELRHRLRALKLKLWRRGATMYRELMALSAFATEPRTVAANGRRRWRYSYGVRNRAMPIDDLVRLGVPRRS